MMLCYNNYRCITTPLATTSLGTHNLHSNPNSEADPNPNPSLNPNPNPIVSALRDCPNIAQFVKYCTIDNLINGAAHLVKLAIDQM